MLTKMGWFSGELYLANWGAKSNYTNSVKVWMGLQWHLHILVPAYIVQKGKEPKKYEELRTQTLMKCETPALIQQLKVK